MKILILNKDQLNKIFNGLGDIIVSVLDSKFQDKSYILVHKDSSADLFSTLPNNQFKQLSEILIHYLNFHQYQVLQINK